MKKPKVESSATLEKYLHRIDMPDVLTLIPKDSTAFIILDKEFLKSLPDYLVFNSLGYLLYFKDPGTCNNPFDSLSSTLCRSSLSIKDSTTHLNKLLQNTMPLDSNDHLTFRARWQETPDYTVVILWTRYIGYLNKRDVKGWVQNTLSLNECRVSTYLLNMDNVKETFQLK